MSEVKQKCRYCREGHKQNEEGEHWIVKSIIPAKIEIRKCKNFVTHTQTDKGGE